MASFLDVKIAETEVEKLALHLDFSNIEKNETVNQNVAKQLGVATEDAKFMRKGNQLMTYYQSKDNYIHDFILIDKESLAIGRTTLVRN